MSALITEHEIEPHPDNDPSHPIPCPKVLDVVGISKEGGARLSIIVASPLLGDPYSQTRLLDKIEGYLVHISSAEFQTEAGLPTPENTTITVVLHPDSAPEIQDLLRRSEGWVRSNNATLAVEELRANVHQGGT
jgi:hypothetical protein